MIMSATRSNVTIWVLLCSLFTVALFPAAKPDHSPDRYDARQYLAAAINLHDNGIFSEVDGSNSGPGTGREPAYATFLAGLMFFDAQLASITLECLRSADGCGAERYRFAIILNRVFVALSGALIFLSVFRLTDHNLFPSAISGLYIWLNFESQKFSSYVISDSLAMFLSAILIWSIFHAGHRGSALWWAISGFVMALLVLTKAIFLYFALLVIPLFLFLTLTSDDCRRTFRNALICFLCCAVPVSAWIARNVAVDDLWGVTEGRGEITVSAREIYNDMTFTEYFAAMVYWTRIKGDGLAHVLFSQETLGKLRHDTSDGFFQRGHKRFSELVERKKTAENISYEAASKEVYDQLLERVLKRPVRHFFTTALLAYRGVWIDQFAPFGVLASFFIIISAARRRNYVVLFALFPSVFAFIFYPLISLNVPRYQMVTIPAFALASGMFAVRFNHKLMEVKKRWSSRNFLKRKGERNSI